MVLLIGAVVVFLAYTAAMVAYKGFDIISICLLALVGYLAYLHGESVFTKRKQRKYDSSRGN